MFSDSAGPCMSCQLVSVRYYLQGCKWGEMKYLNAKWPIFLMEALISFSRRLGAIFKWPVGFCLCDSHKQKLAIVLCELTGIRAAYTAIGLNFSGALWRLAAILL